MTEYLLSFNLEDPRIEQASYTPIDFALYFCRNKGLGHISLKLKSHKAQVVRLKTTQSDHSLASASVSRSG